ncbi:GntR family transcriptional regulator [Actinocorallia aurantiaca]|uniref:GntR family transcriptional regulator n=1 Tax=Actinocorallia aurantiaca TaxID=46204 RepID=UPI0031D32523
MNSGRVPRYRAIAEDLAQKIRSGRYRAGDALPPQRELSTSYGVTLMTLRQALQVLNDDGLIVQQPGRGTFVAPPHAEYRLDTLKSLGDELRKQGYPVRTEVVSTTLRPIPASLSKPMGLPAGHKGLRLTRVRHLSRQPVIHQVSWIPEPIASAIKGVDFGEVPLYTALAQAGVRVHRASERIRPSLLTGSVAELLERSPGGPVFFSERVTYDADGLVAVLDQATIVGDALEIRTDRATTDLSLEWISQHF